jgi:uncharacterized membrane protein YhhN
MATATIARGNARPIEEVALRRIPLATLVGAVIGTAANVIIFLLGRATGAIGDSVTLSNGQVFGAPAVITMTIMPAILAGIFFAILGAIGRIRRPVTVFRVVALVILVLSLASPFTIAGVGAGFIAFLVLMHLAAGASIVWSLTTLARR